MDPVSVIGWRTAQMFDWSKVEIILQISKKTLFYKEIHLLVMYCYCYCQLPRENHQNQSFVTFRSKTLCWLFFDFLLLSLWQKGESLTCDKLPLIFNRHQFWCVNNKHLLRNFAPRNFVPSPMVEVTIKIFKKSLNHRLVKFSLTIDRSSSIISFLFLVTTI